MLGNDIAIKAFRDGKLPYPDGTIIAALHYGHVASEENDKVFGDPQSFVPGLPTNVQFILQRNVRPRSRQCQRREMCIPGSGAAGR
jgi:hypothetical protein